MNQLSKEIQDLIKQEMKEYGDNEFPKQHYTGIHVKTTAKYGYLAGAKKWALMMEEFAEWLAKKKWKRYSNGKWSIPSAGYGGGEPIEYTTSELLTLFISK